jgi:hypothetical protein
MRIKTLFVVVGLASTIGAKAQLSVGVDFAFPTGDFGKTYGFGVGPSLGYDLNLGGMLTVFGQASYDFLMVKSDYSDLVSSSYIIPYQAGLKVYLGGDSQGLYGMGLLGGHTVGSKVTILGTETSDSSTLFSWGLGGGYHTGKLDLGVRYNSISKEKDVDGANASNYIGLRVGFMLGGD